MNPFYVHFFQKVQFGSCHVPYLALERDRKLHDHLESDRLPDRYGEITAMDRAVGQLRTASSFWGSALVQRPLNNWTFAFLNFKINCVRILASKY